MSFEDQLGGRGNNSSYGGNRNFGKQPDRYSANPGSYGNQSNNSVQMNYQTGPSYGGNASSYGYGETKQYDQIVKIVTDNIRQLSVNNSQIRTLSEQLGTTRDSMESRDKLRQLIDLSRSLSNDTAHSIKSLHDSKSSGAAEDRTRRMHQQKLMKDLQTALQQFQEISKYAAEKEKSTPIPQQKQPAARGSDGPGFRYYDEDRDVEKQSLMEAQRNQQMQIENERGFMDALIADREQGIKEIEKTVLEVNEIFRDLSHLVQEQGTMIDNIESNIEESVVKVDQGVQELRSANEYQKSSRNKMCCLALILLIIAAIAVLVIYFGLIKK